MAEKIKHIETKINSIDDKIDKLPEHLAHMFVSKVEFESTKIDVDYMKKVVFGAIGVILTTVLLALVYLVLNRGSF